MPLSDSLHISASGLTAERLRLDVISNNIANASTTRTASGQPYRRQEVIFAARESAPFATMLASARSGSKSCAAGAGVNVTAVQPDMQHDFKTVYEPGHPDADAKGYVRMPNVEPITEMVDMISATRSYEAGITAINSAKQMEQKALEIGRA